MRRKTISRILGVFTTGVLTLSSIPVLPVSAETETVLSEDTEEAEVDISSPASIEEDNEETFVEVDLSDVLVQAGGFKAPERTQTGSAGKYYSSSDNYVAAKNKLTAALLNWEDTVDISEYNIPRDEISTLFASVVNVNPELFFVERRFSYSYKNASNEQYITKVSLEYKEEYSKEDVAALRAKGQEILAMIDDDWTDLETVLFLHDYLVLHAEYQKTQPYSKYNAYDALVGGEAVCNGYALAYTYLLSLAGFESEVVVSDTMSHAWNLIRLDGEYYYVDTTWDDHSPTYTRRTYCEHDNFLVSRDGLEETKHEGTDWYGTKTNRNVYTEVDVSDNYADYFWKGIDSALPLDGTETAYCNEGKIHVYDFATMQETASYNYQRELWPYLEQEGWTYPGDYSCLSLLNGVWYYLVPDGIYSMTTEGVSKRVYTITADEKAAGRMYGLMPENGKLYYEVAKHPTTDTLMDGYFSIKTSTQVQSVALDKESADLMVGETMDLEVTISPSDATNKTVSWSSDNESVATVDENGTVTAVAAGIATITATTEDGGKTASCEVTVSGEELHISMNVTSISLSVGAKMYVIAEVVPAPETSPVLVYSSGDESVATISSTGMVTAIASGTTTITVETMDGTLSQTCPITVTGIDVSSVSLNKTELELTEGQSGILTATLTPADATNKNVSWSSSKESVATVDVNGKVTAVAAGTATITATTEDGGFTSSCEVTVVEAPPVTINVISVSLDKETLELTEGEYGILTATINPEDATNKNVSWSSSKESVATVDANGKVTAVKAGTATITVTTEDGGFTSSCEVTVNEAEPVVQAEEFVDRMYNMSIGVVGDTTARNKWVNNIETGTMNGATFAYRFLFSDEILKLGLSDEEFVTMLYKCMMGRAADEAGMALWVGEIRGGSSSREEVAYAFIESTEFDNICKNYGIECGEIDNISAPQNVKVEYDEEKFVISWDPVVIDFGTNAKLRPEYYEIFLYQKEEDTVEGQEISRLRMMGRVTGDSNKWSYTQSENLTGGDVYSFRVRALLRDYESLYSKITENSIYVVQVAESVGLDKVELELTEGESATLTATISPSDAINKNVSWSSSKESVATVDENGKVTAVAAGTATITVTTEDGGYTASCEVTVVEAPPVAIDVESVSLDKVELELTEGESATLIATITPEDATNKNVSWSSSKESVATVDENGKVTAVAAGTATITVTTEDGEYTATCEVMVVEAPPVTVDVESVSLDKTELELTEGEYGTLTAVITPEDATNKNVIWSSDKDEVATVDENGTVTAVAAGTATITVTTEDGEYTASCEVTVVEAPPVAINVESVSLDKAELELTEGEGDTLVATVTPEDATNKTVIWSSDKDEVATVSENGTVTAVAAGTATITVTTEDGEYTASCEVTVVEASPVTIDVESVSLNKTKLELTVNESETLVATVNPEDATNKTVTWSSIDETVATVDVNGKVTALSPGVTIITVTTEDGEFTANCEVTVKVEFIPEPHEQVVSFVDRIYTVWLERTSDSDGAADWTKKLEDKSWSGAQVAEFFVFSKESMDKNRSNEDFIDALYKLLMNRDPAEDPSGYAYWKEQMQNGMSKYQLVASFIASPEYTKICTDYGIERGSLDMDTVNQVQGFVGRFYTLAMERDADQAGVDYWTAGLRRGDFNGASIAANFFFSKEMTDKHISDEKYIELLYQVMMGRASDEGGKAYWLGNMDRGMTKEEVLNGFITSPEFTGICADYGIERGSL